MDRVKLKLNDFIMKSNESRDGLMSDYLHTPIVESVTYPAIYNKELKEILIDEPTTQQCRTPCLSKCIFFTTIFFVCILFPISYLWYCFDSVYGSWNVNDNLLEKLFYHAASNNSLPNPPRALSDQCLALTNSDKFDCYPESGASKEACEARGCCWVEVIGKKKIDKNGIDVPYCFYPDNYGGYEVQTIKNSSDGFIEVLLQRTFKGPYPNDLETVRITVIPRTANTVQIKISSPLGDRYTPIYPEIPIVDKSNYYKGPTDYQVKFSSNTTGFQVFRNDTLLFDTQNIGGFIFADQFLQLSAQLPDGVSLYGLGDNQQSLKLNLNWNLLTFFNADAAPTENINLYGTQPFYLAMEETGMSHGVFLLNSNAMEIVLQPMPAITYRTIGGEIDLFIMTGPSPKEVVKQYQALVGLPNMPPLWSLGFHLCRFGYNSVNNTRNVLTRNLNAGIPIDVQWNDIDYMDRHNDFTYDHVNFKNLPQFINDLHEKGLKWVPILDPGISSAEPKGSYPPYDNGVVMNTLVKNTKGDVFVGKVWNDNATAFVDFTSSNILPYWSGLLKSLHSEVPFDGIWIDMNEPSNFYSGEINGCPDNNLENPPYVPYISGGTLKFKTVCMSAKQEAGNHYDLHNLYGISENAQTYNSLLEVLPNKRPFILTRSTFSGVGRYSAHWSGDVFSQWHDLAMSIPALLSFGIFAVPLMGSDICGFNGNTTEELCARWFQLGAFYPFSRSHNTDDAIDQDPLGLGDLVATASKQALLTRYSLMSYLYTLFYHANIDGETVARALFFEFPNDSKTYEIDSQFLWGSGLMIVPALQPNQSSVSAYLPKNIWYDFYNGTIYDSKGQNFDLDTPYDKVVLLVRGGFILTKQAPKMTTTLTKMNPIELLVALDNDGKANGDIYFDDGESFDTQKIENYTLLDITCANNNIVIKPITLNYKDISRAGKITVYGIQKPVTKVEINKQSATFDYNSNSKVLTIDNINQELPNLQVTWT